MMKTCVAVGLLVALQGRPPGNGPEVGAEAPNFTAKVIGGKETVELKKVVEKEKKPVVLVFGSYT